MQNLLTRVDFAPNHNCRSTLAPLATADSCLFWPTNNAPQQPLAPLHGCGDMVDTMPFPVPFQGTPRRTFNACAEGASALVPCGGVMTHADHPNVAPPSVIQAARALQALRNGCEMQPPINFAPWPAYYRQLPPPPPPPPQPISLISPYPPQVTGLSDQSIDDTPRGRFMAVVARLQAEAGTPLVRVPEMGSKALDLFTLHKEVTARGGMNVVVERKLWKPVALALGIPLGSCTDYGYRLRRHYERYVLPYELKHAGTSSAIGRQKRRKGHRSERSANRRRQPSQAVVERDCDSPVNPYSKRVKYDHTYHTP